MTAPSADSRPRSSRLSTGLVIVIAVVATFALAGLGLLVGASAESDTKLPGRLNGNGAGVKGSFQLGAQALGHVGRSFVGVGAADPSGSGVTLGNPPIVTVPVPDGWDSTVSDPPNLAVFVSKPGFMFYVNPFVPAVKPDPAAQVSSVFNTWVLQNQNYTQLNYSDVRLDPDLDGNAYVLYEGLETFPSGTFAMVGEVDVYVSSDGTVLALQEEASGTTADDALEALQTDTEAHAIFNGTVNSFLNG